MDSFLQFLHVVICICIGVYWIAIANEYHRDIPVLNDALIGCGWLLLAYAAIFITWL